MGELMRHTTKILFCTVMTGAMFAAPVQAQNWGNLLGGLIKDSARSSQMKKACLNEQFASTYARHMMGATVFGSGYGDGPAVERANALAEEIAGRATITDWSFKKWDGGTVDGSCLMTFAMTLAPEDAAHFNNSSVWGGDVRVDIRNRDGRWEATSFADNGARDIASGWLAVWLRERASMPGGAPRLASPLPPAQLDMKIREASGCSSSVTIQMDVFPAYNAWLEALNVRSFLNFRVELGSGRLEHGRLVSSDSHQITCRYDISTAGHWGGPQRAIRNLDMRFTVVQGRPKWEVASFPTAPEAAYTPAQVEQLLSQVYIDGQPLQEWTAAQGNKPAQPQPRNVIEAMAQAQQQANADADAYMRSQGIDVDAFKQAEDEETRKHADACRRNGGTWGWPTDQYGNQRRLGCYYPTGER